MQKWEYMIVIGPKWRRAINELGEQGWEPVAFIPYGKAYLKRLKG